MTKCLATLWPNEVDTKKLTIASTHRHTDKTEIIGKIWEKNKKHNEKEGIGESLSQSGFKDHIEVK